MAGKLKRVAGPAFVANSATNIYTPAASTIETKITQLHFTNVTTSAVTVTVYIGGTGGSSAGTEILKDYSIAAKSTYDLYFPGLFMASTDFLVGIASSASALTVVVTGEFSVV